MLTVIKNERSEVVVDRTTVQTSKKAFQIFICVRNIPQNIQTAMYTFDQGCNDRYCISQSGHACILYFHFKIQTIGYSHSVHFQQSILNTLITKYLKTLF